MRRQFLFLIIAFIAVLFYGCGKEAPEITEVISEEAYERELLSEESTIVVQIDGAVNDPGVYELPGGSRIRDLVEAAGGMCDDAVLESINLAEIATDGMRYHVMTITEYEAGRDGASAMVNINTATIKELMTLAGIGESKAKSIVEYRKKNGLFKSVEDLLKVSGIKRGTLNKIMDDITI